MQPLAVHAHRVTRASGYMTTETGLRVKGRLLPDLPAGDPVVGSAASRDAREGNGGLPDHTAGGSLLLHPGLGQSEPDRTVHERIPIRTCTNDPTYARRGGLQNSLGKNTLYKGRLQPSASLR